MIALLSCLTYIALDFFGAKRPAILGRFKVPLTQVAGLIAFWARDEAWARDFWWPSYRPSARPRVCPARPCYAMHVGRYASRPRMSPARHRRD